MRGGLKQFLRKEIFGNNILDTPNRQGVEFISDIFTPNRLVSLFQMLQFSAKEFVFLMNMLSSLKAELKVIAENNLDPDDKPISENIKSAWVAILKLINKHCEEIGLSNSITLIQRVISELRSPDYTYPKYGARLEELKDRIYDEMSQPLFLTIKQDKAIYFNQASLFGESVFNNFPSASFDIEEAGKCFAVGRSTACVMHLMRCIEVGLKAVGTGSKRCESSKSKLANNHQSSK